jgi:regulation of enolase protein 1 (concanavalin A-like superfamily)
MYLSGGTYTADFTGALLLPIGIFRTIHGNFTATMKFDYDPTQTSDNFGFILHQPNFRGWMYYSRLHHEQISGVEKLYRREVVNWGGILDTPTPPTVTATQGIYLRVIRQDTALHTQYSTDGSTYATCPANATTWQPHASDPVVLWICTWSEGSHITTGTVDFLHITQP